MVRDNKNDTAFPHKVFLWPEEPASGGEDQRRPPVLVLLYCSRQLKKVTVSCDDLHKKKKKSCVFSFRSSLSVLLMQNYSACVSILGRGEASVGFS